MGSPRLATTHLREKADEAIAASGNQAGEPCSDRVACERQVQTSLERERICRGQAREHRTDLVFFASKCSVQCLVSFFVRVERHEDLGLEGNRGPRHLRLDCFEVHVVYRGR